MRKHRLDRRQRKHRKKMIIFSVAAIVCFFSVGYATFSQNFLVSGKGTIVEKPITIDELKLTKVTSGDGLYEDAYEEGKYFYKGTNPNNYIMFNWYNHRIISIENDNTIKIIKEISIGNIVIDPGYSVSIPGLTDSNSVNGTRYSNVTTDYCYPNGGVESNYYGCNVWGSKTTMLDKAGVNITKMPRTVGGATTYNLPVSEAYLNTYLNSTWYNQLSEKVKTMVDNHTWNVGVIKDEAGQTIENDLHQESEYKWRGKVGLISATDYIKTNTNKDLCGSVYANTYDANNYATCKTTTWLFNNTYQWTISPYSSTDPDRLWHINPNGFIYSNRGAYAANSVRPAVYLVSSIKLSGKGTKNNPYVIIT